jgi:hypothetical protein
MERSGDQSMPIEKVTPPLPSISYPAASTSTGPLWEEVSTEFESRSVALMIVGDTDSGRSTLALTAPGPIAYIHSYEKVDGLINEARKTKLIRASKFGGDLRGSSERVQDLAEAQVRKMEAAISDAYSWARSIIVDTESKAWEVHQLARLGTLEHSEKSKEDKKSGQLVYAGINNRWASMLQEYRIRAEKPLQEKPTNLILICKTKDEYAKNPAGKVESTGRTIPACQKDTPFFADVRLRTRVKISQFSVTVEKPWWNADMRGFELSGGKDILTIPNLMSLITMTDQSEWE